MRGTHRGGIVVLFLLALAGAGCGVDDHGHDHDHPEHAEGAAHDHLPADEATLGAMGVTLESAGPGRIARTLELPGKVVLNEDRLAHVTARVSGVAESVRFSLGDEVRAGELLAVIDSAELADAKSVLLSARATLDLASATLEREESLFEKGVSSESELLEARRALAEARIDERAALQRLLTLGVSPRIAEKLRAAEPGVPLSRYELRAPISGRVIERHLTPGESVDTSEMLFAIADIEAVWVDLSVYQRDLPFLREGQRVALRTDHDDLTGDAAIAFVQPIVEEDDRTALARLELDNSSGEWHPGCFVTGSVEVGALEVPVRVASSALQQLDEERRVVFVRHGEGLEPRDVRVGVSDGTWTEIVEGLSAGEIYAAGRTFALKAELLKDSFGGGHAH